MGTIVWGTRYYLESLLVAYDATGNPKYLDAFLDSGSWVMNLIQTIPVLNAVDPTAPGATGSILAVTGWPTLNGNFGVPVPVPTPDGKVSLYAQSLTPYGGADILQVSQQGDGTLQLAWLGSANQVLQTFKIASLSDLQALAAQPLIWGQSLARIIPTGLGMPAIAEYRIDSQEKTVWHEQTSGILLPFARFLLIAKDHPEIADPDTLAQWESRILSITSSYENEFVPDGNGGLRLVNPVWLPNSVAGIDAAADYIFVEARLRLFLYELTNDAHHLSIAKGLVGHQRHFHWFVDNHGWLDLQFWPCLFSWNDRASAPAGSIWDEVQFDPTTPSPAIDASFVADLFKSAQEYGLQQELGITAFYYRAQQAAFVDYMVGGHSYSLYGPNGLIRSAFPSLGSTTGDWLIYSSDPFAAAAWVNPDLSDSAFANVNWNWMLQYGRQTQGVPIGYFLRAWARSEAAELRACQASEAVESKH